MEKELIKLAYVLGMEMERLPEVKKIADRERRKDKGIVERYSNYFVVLEHIEGEEYTMLLLRDYVMKNPYGFVVFFSESVDREKVFSYVEELQKVLEIKGNFPKGEIKNLEKGYCYTFVGGKRKKQAEFRMIALPIEYKEIVDVYFNESPEEDFLVGIGAYLLYAFANVSDFNKLLYAFSQVMIAIASDRANRELEEGRIKTIAEIFR